MARLDSPENTANEIVQVNLTDGKQLPTYGQMHAPVLVTSNPKMHSASLITALTDSGNLLSHSAVNAGIHSTLWIGTLNMEIVARSATKQTMKLQGRSKGIFIKFPHISIVFHIKPLVIHQLSTHLNLGA